MTTTETTITDIHDLTVSVAECPLCSSYDRQRVDARDAFAARAQNLHMHTDKYIRQLKTGGLGYDGLGQWTDRLLAVGDDWSSCQSKLSNAEWRYRNAIAEHTKLQALCRCETEQMSEIPAHDEDYNGREQTGPAYRLIPLDEVERILDEEQQFFEKHLEWLRSNHAVPTTATAAIAVICYIRQQIADIANHEKGQNNA